MVDGRGGKLVGLHHVLLQDAGLGLGHVLEMRSRDVESGITLEYLQALYIGYEEFIASISKLTPVIRVDYDRFPTIEEMADVIQREYLDANFLREVTRFDPTR